ncbi:MAG: universal stress protein [Verrucomicrobiota bacterium]|jgi:nucleotide-binding universal stress UspA family protein
MFRKILVGYDGSKGGRAALERAAALAREGGGQLTALWVRQPLPRHADLPGEPEGEAEAAREYFEERKGEVQEAAKRLGLTIACESRSGHAAKVMVTFAMDGGYDLIVVGHSDHSELWGRLLGDTADRISDHAHCSVLIVKQPESSSGDTIKAG